MDEVTITVNLGEPSSFMDLDDGELQGLIMLATQEQQRRAREDGDLNALIEEGFETGFSSAGVPKEPYLRGGILVLPGGRIDKSSTSHTCSFGHIGEDWVWESEDKIFDSVRNIPGPKAQMRSVTLIAAHEGMEIDFISSRTRGGIHEMVSNKSFIIKNGELTPVSVRAPKARNHR